MGQKRAKRIFHPCLKLLSLANKARSFKTISVGQQVRSLTPERRRRIRAHAEAARGARSVPMLRCQAQIRGVPTAFWRPSYVLSTGLNFRGVNIRDHR